MSTTLNRHPICPQLCHRWITFPAGMTASEQRDGETVCIGCGKKLTEPCTVTIPDELETLWKEDLREGDNYWPFNVEWFSQNSSDGAKVVLRHHKFKGLTCTLDWSSLFCVVYLQPVNPVLPSGHGLEPVVKALEAFLKRGFTAIEGPNAPDRDVPQGRILLRRFITLPIRLDNGRDPHGPRPSTLVHSPGLVRAMLTWDKAISANSIVPITEETLERS